MCRALCFCLVTGWVVSGWGGRPAWASENGSLSADKWVERLGADEFNEREEAAKRLLALGTAARAALLEGLRAPDLEVRVRSRALLQEIVHSGFESRLKAFISGKPGASPPPGWDKFKSIVGDRPVARQLYAEMFRQDGDLLAAATNKDGAMSWLEDFRKKVTAIQRERMTRMRAGMVRIDKEALATLMFLTSEKCIGPNQSADSAVMQVYPLLIDTTSDIMFRDPMMLKLLDSWALGQKSGLGAYYALEVSSRKQRFEISLTLGRRILEDRSAKPNYIPLAAMMVAKAGQVSDVPLIERHLSNTTRFSTHHNPRVRKEPIPIEVRDIVLAMLVHLTGQKLEDYGFKHARPDPVTVYNRYYLFILSDEARQAGLKRWKTWRAAHPKLGEN